MYFPKEAEQKIVKPIWATRPIKMIKGLRCFFRIYFFIWRKCFHFFSTFHRNTCIYACSWLNGQLACDNLSFNSSRRLQRQNSCDIYISFNSSCDIWIFTNNFSWNYSFLTYYNFSCSRDSPFNFSVNSKICLWGDVTNYYCCFFNNIDLIWFSILLHLFVIW